MSYLVLSRPVLCCPALFCQGAILDVGVQWRRLLARTGRSIVACAVGGAPGRGEAPNDPVCSN